MIEFLRKHGYTVLNRKYIYFMLEYIYPNKGGYGLWRETIPSSFLKIKKIRTAWDEEQEEWYFSVQDVVAVLTDRVDLK